jgi:hypothetical protein
VTPLGRIVGVDEVALPSVGLAALASEERADLALRRRTRSRMIDEKAAVVAGDDAAGAESRPAKEGAAPLRADEAVCALGDGRGEGRASPVAEIAGAAQSPSETARRNDFAAGTALCA